MACGKLAPEVRSEPFYKHPAIDLKIKIRMVCKYERGQSLSAIAHELGCTVSTMNTNGIDAACVKEHKKGMAMMVCLKLTYSVTTYIIKKQ
jgi:hypothetical protein